MSAFAGHRRAITRRPGSHRRRRGYALLAALLLGLVPATRAAGAPAGGAGDLALSKASLPASVSAGNLFASRITVANVGGKAMSATVTDTHAGGATFDSGPSGCTAAGNVITCAVPSLKPGQSTSVDLLFRAPAAAATVTDTAVIAATSAPDNNPDNDTASASTVVTAAGACPASDPGCLAHGAGVVLPNVPVQTGQQRVTSPSAVVVDRLDVQTQDPTLCNGICYYQHRVLLKFVEVPGFLNLDPNHPVVTDLVLPWARGLKCRGLGEDPCPLRVTFDGVETFVVPFCPGARGTVAGSGRLGQGQRTCINQQSQTNEVARYQVLSLSRDPNWF